MKRFNLQSTILVLAVLVILIMAFQSCNVNNDAEKVYLNLVNKHIPSDRESGSCTVGNTRGDAYIILSPENLDVTVKYRAITSFSQYTGEFVYSSWYEENGELTDLEFKEDDKNPGFYEIIGKWDNKTAGDGYFTLKIFEETKKNTLLIQISGSDWSYFENVEFDDKKFQAIKEILKNPKLNKQSSNAEPEGIKDNKTIEKESDALGMEKKTLTDLANYGEYVTERGNITETLYFTFTEDSNLAAAYTSSNLTNRIELGIVYVDGNTVLENGVYFKNKPSVIYTIRNISDDNVSFDLYDPTDGTTQKFNAVQH